MRIYRIAVADGEFRDLKDRVNSLKDDVKAIKGDSKDFESRIKKLEKTIDDLNIGYRRLYQPINAFTSLQRKIEKFEKMMSEWDNFKKETEDNIKKQIEKSTKAQVKI